MMLQPKKNVFGPAAVQALTLAFKVLLMALFPTKPVNPIPVVKSLF
jgi:hypothetical protein